MHQGEKMWLSEVVITRLKPSDFDDVSTINHEWAFDKKG